MNITELNNVLLSRISKNLHRSEKEENIHEIDEINYLRLLEKYGFIEIKNGNVISVTCAYTGDKFYNKDGWQLDHLIPHSRGGGTVIFNLVPASDIFNNKKSDNELISWWTNNEYWDDESYDRLNNIISFILEGYYLSLKKESTPININIDEDESILSTYTDLSISDRKVKSKRVKKTEIKYHHFLINCINELSKNEKYKDNVNKYYNQLNNLINMGIFEKLDNSEMYYKALEEVLNEYNIENIQTVISNYKILKLANSIKGKTKEEIKNEIRNRFEKIRIILDDEAYFNAYLSNLSKVKNYEFDENINPNIKESLKKHVDKVDSWSFMYNLAKEYYEQNANLDVISKYTIQVPNEKKSINLGNWITRQRTAYKIEELIKQGLTLQKQQEYQKNALNF